MRLYGEELDEAARGRGWMRLYGEELDEAARGRGWMRLYGEGLDAWARMGEGLNAWAHMGEGLDRLAWKIKGLDETACTTLRGLEYTSLQYIFMATKYVLKEVAIAGISHMQSKILNKIFEKAETIGNMQRVSYCVFTIGYLGAVVD